jgi:hypothetical protein
MKKLLLSISLLTIIISFQSCIDYPDNEGASIFSKKFRLVGTEWVSTEIIVTSIENGIYNEDRTDRQYGRITFNRDGTCSSTSYSLVPSSGQIINNGELTREYVWQNNKEEILFLDSLDALNIVTKWEIRRLDLSNLWVISTNSFNDFTWEVKYEAAN